MKSDASNPKWRLPILLCLGCGLYFLLSFQRTAVPGAVFDELLALYPRANANTVVSFGTAFLYPYAFMQIMTGLCLDRWGGERMISVGGALFALGAILFPFLGSAEAGWLCRGLIGVGGGTIYLGLINLAMRCTSPRRYGLAVAMIMFFGYAGMVFASTPLVLLVQKFGLRWIMALAGALTALLWMLFVAVMNTGKCPPINRAAHLSLAAFGPVLRRPQNLYMLGFSALGYSGYYVIQTIIGKKFLEDFSGAEAIFASVVLGTMALLGAFSNIFFAWISNILDGRRTAICRVLALIYLVAIVTPMIMIGLGYRWGIVFACCFCVLSFICGNNSVTVPIVTNNNPGSAGCALSFSNFTFYAANGIIGNIAGVVLNAFTPAGTRVDGATVFNPHAYLTIFAILAVIAFVVLISAWKLRDPGEASPGSANNKC